MGSQGRDPEERCKEALIAIGQVADEAADKRWTVDEETVVDAIEAVKSLSEVDEDLDTESIVSDLERVRSTAASHSRRVDHMAVQDMNFELERELADRELI